MTGPLGRDTRHFEPSLTALSSIPNWDYLHDKRSTMDTGETWLARNVHLPTTDHFYLREVHDCRFRTSLTLPQKR